MCKPHKTQGASRWKPREEQALREFENGMQETT